MMDINTGKALSLPKSIKQSVFDILQTSKYETVLNRNYGSDCPNLIDAPSSLVLPVLTSTIIHDINAWETRTKAEGATINKDDIGKIQVNIKLTNKTLKGELNHEYA